MSNFPYNLFSSLALIYHNKINECNVIVNMEIFTFCLYLLLLLPLLVAAYYFILCIILFFWMFEEANVNVRKVRVCLHAITAFI